MAMVPKRHAMLILILEGIQLDSGQGISHQPFPSWLSRCLMKRTMLHWCQVRALQGVMMSGVVLWTTDIGGYSGGDPKDPQFQVKTYNFRIFWGVMQKTHNSSLFGQYSPQSSYHVMVAGSDCPLVPVWCFLSTFPPARGEGRFRD